jgi:tetratricopeptide (TPR) repeat protein
MKPALVLVGCALALSSAGGVAALGHAPDVWERAANPALQANEETHRQVEALLVPLVATPGDYWDSAQGKEQLRTALGALDDAHADTAPDVRLRFDLGRVVYHLQEDYARAARALESALHEAPDDPLATQSYFMLGIAYAKMQQPEREIGTYDEYLRRESNVSGRAMALSNRAEAEMLVHRLGPAIADYRASLLLRPDEPLSHWGLAIALDRTGDAPGAMAEAKAAVMYDPLDQELTRSDVFFMPPYDLYFYQALGAMARAQTADDAGTSVLWWETAVAKWMEYLAAAPSSDPWITLVRAHQASCEKQLALAKRKSKKVGKAKSADR